MTSIKALAERQFLPSESTTVQKSALNEIKAKQEQIRQLETAKEVADVELSTAQDVYKSALDS